MRLLNVSIFFTLFLALVFITHSLLSLTHTQQFMYVCLYNYMYIFAYFRIYSITFIPLAGCFCFIGLSTCHCPANL